MLKRSHNAKKLTLGLAIAGTIFAGYLSLVKYTSGVCAFDAACPYFFGQPACYYGFALFCSIALLLALGYQNVIQENTAGVAACIISFLGILFSGYFTVQELPLFFSRGFNAYLLGLPTCALGMAFYIGICSLTLGSFAKMCHTNLTKFFKH